jgi:predicted dehydrogenase
MTTPAPIRWGLLGTGDITRKLLAGARRSAEVVVTAVGSRTLERARTFAVANDIPRNHGSYDELLADPEVDAVYISLPNALHHPWTMASLAAGKHVLCEKPYTRHPAQVTGAFDAADAAGLVLAEGFMWRHTPQVRKLLELEDMNAAIRGEREPLLGRADALGQARAIDALYRAADTGTVVSLD